MEAVEITSNATRIRLDTFWLEDESHIWWDWVRVSRDPKTMTWGEFRELFMDKFFSASSRHAKAQEFLELKQGNMTVLEYIAKFTELTRFGDDYVVTDMTKVRKFEDGLKLSIRGKIVGFLLQDMDFMVRTAMAIEREIEDARSIRATGTSEKSHPLRHSVDCRINPPPDQTKVSLNVFSTAKTGNKSWIKTKDSRFKIFLSKHGFKN